MSGGMKPGTIVVYPADILLYGKLLIVGTHPDGRLECEQVHADRRGEFARDLFWPQELEEFRPLGCWPGCGMKRPRNRPVAQHYACVFLREWPNGRVIAHYRAWY